MSSPVFYLKTWEEFTIKHGGEVCNSHTKYLAPKLISTKDTLRKIRLKIPFSGGLINYYSGETSSVKIVYVFKNNINFNFIIHQEDFMDKVGKLFGIDEINLFGSKFDSLYFIKTTHAEKLRKIFSPDIQAFLIKHHRFVANLKLELNKNVSVLEFNFPFDERNMEKMEDTLEFMKSIIINIKTECRH